MAAAEHEAGTQPDDPFELSSSSEQHSGSAGIHHNSDGGVCGRRSGRGPGTNEFEQEGGRQQHALGRGERARASSGAGGRAPGLDGDGGVGRAGRDSSGAANAAREVRGGRGMREQGVGCSAAGRQQDEAGPSRGTLPPRTHAQHHHHQHHHRPQQQQQQLVQVQEHEPDHPWLPLSQTQLLLHPHRHPYHHPQPLHPHHHPHHHPQPQPQLHPKAQELHEIITQLLDHIQHPTSQPHLPPSQQEHAARLQRQYAHVLAYLQLHLRLTPCQAEGHRHGSPNGGCPVSLQQEQEQERLELTRDVLRGIQVQLQSHPPGVPPPQEELDQLNVLFREQQVST